MSGSLGVHTLGTTTAATEADSQWIPPFVSFQIVQARMWAQGLTIGVVLAAGALTHAHRTRMQEEGAVRHLVSCGRETLGESAV